VNQCFYPYEVRVVDSAGDPDRGRVGGFTQSGCDRTQSGDAGCSRRATSDDRERRHHNRLGEGDLLDRRPRAVDRGLWETLLCAGSHHPVGCGLHPEKEAGWRCL